MRLAFDRLQREPPGTAGSVVRAHGPLGYAGRLSALSARRVCKSPPAEFLPYLMPYPDWDEVPLVDIKKYEAGLGGYTRAVIGIRFRRNSLAQGWLRTDQDKA